jgi:hypothetical protein
VLRGRRRGEGPSAAGGARPLRRCGHDQEDWGWFIWFRHGHLNLAIDIFTDDPDEGAFRIHLTSRTTRLLLFDQIVDTPELDELKTLVVTDLTDWVGRAVHVAPISADSEET